MGRSRSTLLCVAAAVVALSFTQPLMAQSRAGGMRVYEARGARPGARSAPRGGLPRVFERRSAQRSRRSHAGRFPHRKPIVFFSLPFAYFPFDPWGYEPYPFAMAAPTPQPPRSPSKVIEVTRSPAGLELRVRYADDRQATIPAADTLPRR